MPKMTPEALRMALTAAAGPSEDGYSGVTHAGIAVVAGDTGRVFLAQRAPDPTDDPEVAETWEFVGGGLDVGEEPFPAVQREWVEETGLDFPTGTVVDGWRGGDQEQYQGFVYLIEHELIIDEWQPTDEVQDVDWFTREMIAEIESGAGLRPEVSDGTDWDLIFGPVSGNEESAMTDTATETLPEPADADYAAETFGLDGPIPVHGVIAPEEMSSGDKRAFGKGAMTKRPLRLPLRDQHTDIGGHSGAVTVGSVDRMMRKDGLIHWEGALMSGEVSEPLVERMQFFGGRYGVSVDGDQGNMDAARTEETGTLWFDQIRAAGLTAVAIPAFHEAYVAFGSHPEMPAEDDGAGDGALVAAAYDSGDLIGAQSPNLLAFKRGPGWVSDPKATNRIHDYWTKPGEPGFAKVAWGTPGDFTRAKRLIGEKIAKNSPSKMKYLNQIIAQWHFDALGYWPGDLDKPGNKTSAQARAERAAKMATQDVDFTEVTDLLTKGLDSEADIQPTDDAESVWEAVLVSSAVTSKGLTVRSRPPLSYFHQHPSMVEDPFAAESGALVIEEPDADGFARTWGYAAEWGVCHVGMSGRCVEPPQSGSDDYPAFHLGRTKTAEGYVSTGVLTYGVGHRDADTMLNESATQAYFDNIRNAWASVRVGENERGIWFSGVVLPKVDAADIVKIEASGQVSGEWLAGAMRACLTVNVPGFPNERPSAAYDENGNVMALAASAFGGVSDSPCTPDDPIGELALAVMERMHAKAKMDALREAEAQDRFNSLKQNWEK